MLRDCQSLIIISFLLRIRRTKHLSGRRDHWYNILCIFPLFKGCVYANGTSSLYSSLDCNRLWDGILNPCENITAWFFFFNCSYNCFHGYCRILIMECLIPFSSIFLSYRFVSLCFCMRWKAENQEEFFIWPQVTDTLYHKKKYRVME